MAVRGRENGKGQDFAVFELTIEPRRITTYGGDTTGVMQSIASHARNIYIHRECPARHRNILGMQR